MRPKSYVLILLCVALLGCGCVEVRQLVKMNHDGSGTLTERIRVLPRAVRFMQRQTGQPTITEAQFALLSDAALQKRMQAFGAVTLKHTQTRKLPDESLEVESVFEFKDLNKVNFWITPTFGSADPKLGGNLHLGYQQILTFSDGHNSATHTRADNLVVSSQHMDLSKQKFSTPAMLQEYRDVVPVFQDMLSDFMFELQIEAPTDVEDFGDGYRNQGMFVEKNRVTPYRVYGANFTMASEMIRSLIMGEFGGDMGGMERSLPDTKTPYYGGSEHGMWVDFAKRVQVNTTATVAPSK
jgi:hypothetical protein